ncbi:MAG: hypothetical protein ABI867_28210 [Kofleriaceae bacterium]
MASCASGGSPNQDLADDDGSPDASLKIDAPGVVPHDARPPIDAPPPLDAFVFLDAPPDAPSAFFCTANNQCTNAGECCIRLGQPQGFCGSGIPVGSECLPN